MPAPAGPFRMMPEPEEEGSTWGGSAKDDATPESSDRLDERGTRPRGVIVDRETFVSVDDRCNSSCGRGGTKDGPEASNEAS